METLNLKDCVAASYTEYMKDDWGYVGPDFANGGIKIESAAGPLQLESASGDVTINAGTTYAVNIGTDNHTGAINIGTGGTRTITIGGASTTSIVFDADSLTFNGKRADIFTIISQADNTTISAANLAEPNPVFVMNTGGNGALALPTAANVIANVANAAVDQMIKFYIVNGNGNALSVTAANAANAYGFTGRTLVANGGASEFRILITAIGNAPTYDAFWC